MVLTLKQGSDKKEIKLLETKLAQRMQQKKLDKGFDAKKYKGTVKLKEDPLNTKDQIG